jgi:hypothetical protein
MNSVKLLSTLGATCIVSFLTACGITSKADGNFICKSEIAKREDNYEYDDKKKLMTWISSGDEVFNLELPTSSVGSKVMWRMNADNYAGGHSFVLDRDTMDLKVSTEYEANKNKTAHLKCKWIE